jgi:hypothetical protein
MSASGEYCSAHGSARCGSLSLLGMARPSNTLHGRLHLVYELPYRCQYAHRHLARLGSPKIMVPTRGGPCRASSASQISKCIDAGRGRCSGGLDARTRRSSWPKRAGTAKPPSSSAARVRSLRAPRTFSRVAKKTAPDASRTSCETRSARTSPGDICVDHARGTQTRPQAR